MQQDRKMGIWDPFKTLEEKEKKLKRAKLEPLKGKILDDTMEKVVNYEQATNNKESKIVIKLAGTPKKNQKGNLMEKNALSQENYLRRGYTP